MLRYIIFVIAMPLICAQNDTLDIIHSKMDLDMERFALDTTLDLLKSSNELDKIPDSLVKAMNNKYGKEWMCMVGERASKMILSENFVSNSLLSLKYHQNELVLYQFKVDQQNCNNTQNQKKSFKDILIEASKSTPVTITQGYNQTAHTLIIDSFKSALSSKLNTWINCDETSTLLGSDCYGQLSYALNVLLRDQFKIATDYHLVTSTGIYHSYDSDGNGKGSWNYIINEAIVFGNLYLRVWAVNT